MSSSLSDACVLFLHGGPGLSAEMERRRYRTSLAVHWWDQPRIPANTPKAFDALAEAAELEVKHMADAQGDRVSLLASSFGALLALALLNRIPEMIGAVTFSGGVLDQRAAFMRFGRRLAQKLSDQRLRQAVDAAAENPTRECLWTLINAIIATPGFIDEYWSPWAVEQCTTMRELATQGTLLDFETFEAVVNDVLAVPPPPIPQDPRRYIRVVIGRHDPYAEMGDVGHWRKWFPAATVELVEAGHFPHLELPRELWLPA